MNYKIDEKMEYILDAEKIYNPEYVCKILKEEIEPIVRNYVSLKGEFSISFKKDKNRNIFSIEFDAERIKNFGYIPL